MSEKIELINANSKISTIVDNEITLVRESVVKTSKAVTSGVWYWEIKFLESNNYNYLAFGVSSTNISLHTDNQHSLYTFTNRFEIRKNHADLVGTYTIKVNVGDYIGVILDADNKTFQFFFNGKQYTKKHDISTLTEFTPIFYLANTSVTSKIDVNFGEREFAYLPTEMNQTVLSFNGEQVVSSTNKILAKAKTTAYAYEHIDDWYETNMTSNTTPYPYVISASSYYGSYYPWEAFNGSISAGWLANGVGRAWLQLDFGSIMSVNRVRLGAGWFNLGNAPKDFNILGSNDGVNFDTLLSVTGKSDWVKLESQDFTLPLVSYRYYRIDAIRNNGGANYINIDYVLFGKYTTNLRKLPSISKDNFVKYGTRKLDGFELILDNKNYILQDVVSVNSEGLYTTQLDRKPLSISFK